MPFSELTNIRKRFGAAVAVEDCDLQMEHGELTWFPGPLGVPVTGLSLAQPGGAR
ncbi:MAG: hypothetical protein WB783_14325 [Arenicellales bacterium]|jgi:ABC-type branched-subunit amino acid transport system ATPase component